MTLIPKPFDHELKLRRAQEHLENLNREIRAWLNGNHYSVRHEYDLNAISDMVPSAELGSVYRLDGSVFPPGQPQVPVERARFGQGMYIAYATAERPTSDPLSLLIGDALHNLRSALDALAYALAADADAQREREDARRGLDPRQPEDWRAD